MSHGIFTTLFYIPLYNALIFIINFIPGHSAALAIILLTLVIRFILYPLSRKSIKTQLEMKRLEPKLQKIRETVKDREEQGRQTLKLYKDNDVNPFAGLFLILIQLPILLGIYQVFRSGLPKIDATILYHFVHAPAVINMHFIGINLLNSSVILAIITVITQFIQFQLAMPAPVKSEKRSLQTDLANTVNAQMKYVFPLIMFPIAYISAVLAIYFIASNIFMIFQELFVRRRMMKKFELEDKKIQGKTTEKTA
jgi:YidC/Oxa1 family membrane protein insertase